MDSILYWNHVSLEANRLSHTGQTGEQRGPVLSARALAIVHLAMHDAYFGVVGGARYLRSNPTAPTGASAQAAVATAAYTALVNLFPSQKALFDDALAKAELPNAGLADGRTFGYQVARTILVDRAEDPDASDAGYTPTNDHGSHRVDPNNPGQRFYAPFYGERCKLFAATQRWSLNPPPSLSSTAYHDALKEVRGLGISPELMGTLPPTIVGRTPEETLVGLFWAYDGAQQIGTPPRLYNQLVREIATRRVPANTEAQNARLFALINVAMADAGILAWQEKYRHNLWRPVVAIREHDVSMGPSGLAGHSIDVNCDPGWLPLGAPQSNTRDKAVTPNFPAYPSGHATFGAAALHITQLFYSKTQVGPDDLFAGLDFVSDELNGKTTDSQGTVRPKHTRAFPRGVWDMIRENAISRVYLGVHWKFDAYVADANGDPDLTVNTGGVPLGWTIANDIFNDGMIQP